MQITYISALSSERLINEIYQKSGKNPGFAVQKFSRLLVKGLLTNDERVIAFSNPPITRERSKSLFVNYKTEVENEVCYKYIPFINYPFLKHFCVFFYSFFYVLLWGIKNKKEKALVCDVLTISACMGSLLASKLNGVQTVGVVTDIYGFMAGKASNVLSVLATKMNKMYISAFDKYVLLTEQMNELVNPKRRPHIVMEALCDSLILTKEMPVVPKDSPRTMLYAGGLHVKYGLKMLVDAFFQSGVDGKLVIYGDGPYASKLREVSDKSDKVEYRGVAPNEEVVEAEHKASVLVNPRFTTEAFSPYSFPSKNMEYMASGTPLLTTNLPGMPEEYHEYVYLFGEETVEAYAETIRQVFAKSDEELQQMGALAKKFVLENKNNVAQARRIVKFIK